MKSLHVMFSLTAPLIFFCFTVNAKTQPFEQSLFSKAQTAGKKIVLQFHADWCPTCKKQKVSLTQISSEKKYETIEFFQANYDDETELKKKMAINGQSALIYFKGTVEAGRSQGQTDKDKIVSEIESYLLK